jgi:hypothetical protein
MPLTDAQVLATFGDPRPYIRQDGSIDGAWETAILTTIKLPAPLPASWALGTSISQLRVHRLIAGNMVRALASVRQDYNAWASLGDVGGIYAWRPNRNNSRTLSRHAWGIAIDLDVADNPNGAKVAKMHPGVIAAFREQGFEWGGAWRTTKDPMHFEFSDLGRLTPAAA